MIKSLSYDLGETLRLFKERNTQEMRGLSNRLIKEASIENNLGKAELGVISYALHKIETKDHIINHQNWPRIKNEIVQHLSEAMEAIESGDDNAFMQRLKETIQHIEEVDMEMGRFVQGIYEKAKVKQASLAYSYGLSISQAAELTGANKKELQSYIGFTTMHDEESEVKTIEERVKELREMTEGGLK
ncbi:MAG: hypothetical protein NTZ73_00785 [Candidatus Diapherotrites archaeon]|nr:hypothetical protein [Candidatus Diapherotrites archaeon]